MLAGVDEAGRGPVIGPMVMAILACDDEEVLRKLGSKDSKLLTPEQRRQIAEKLKDFPNEVISLSPAEIDAAVQGKKGGDSLNQLEARTTALLIYKLAQRRPLIKVILDSPTRNAEKYQDAVRNCLENIDSKGVTRNIQLQAEIKADFNHPVVGAASILAKTTRDAAIESLNAIHGPLGSGYPSDPATQAWLAEHWKEPHEFFRRSWGTYQDFANPQSTLSAYEEETQHKEVIASFERLLSHGYSFESPTNPYEILRMKGSGVTVIRYTTGKTLVQGPDPEKKSAEKLLVELGLMKKAGRPKKNG
jgi:ribonuclease HII